MEKKGILHNLVFKLAVGIILGIVVGRFVDSTGISILMAIKNILGDLIKYVVPLIILGFIAPAIVSLKENVGKILTTTLAICYASSVGAAFFAMIAGYIIIPHLNIAGTVGKGNPLPEMLFKLSVSPIMPVMTALVTSILLGLAVLWTKAQAWENLLMEFNKIVLVIVDKVVVRILPIFIFTSFAELSYEGAIISELPVFLKIILIVIVGHIIWMALLYSIAGAISKTNPLEVVKHYGPAYVTALGTMSSAATLSVALKCAGKSGTLDEKIKDFVIPLCSNIHLCGSVLTEVFFVMTVSQILTGAMPSVPVMITFILLFGIFAIAAPGVPGGTVVASLGLLISVLQFDNVATALMLSIFALQDSFGTACNVTSDGAIALMVTGLFKDKKNV